MNIQAFKSFNTDRATDIDELVAGVAFGKALRHQFEELNLEVPEYVDTQLRALQREITSRNSDKAAARKRELLARIDALKTPTQKKAELEAELAKLEAVGV